jgi:hypothetical protein
MHAPAALHLEDTHVADAGLALVTIALGAVGLLLVAADQHIAGAVAGAVAVLTGLSGQLISRTRPERFLDVIGLVAGAVALATGLAFGGLTFAG